MEHSTTITEICTAILELQNRAPVIKKTADNPFYKSKYADLASILDELKPILQELKLLITQHPVENNSLTTMIFHLPSGEWFKSTYNMSPAQLTPQGIGSAITYAKRYSIVAILGLNVDNDDDGNDASTKSETKTESKAEDNKPWMTEKAYNLCISRIGKGEKGVLKNASNAFKIKKEWYAELKKLDNG